MYYFPLHFVIAVSKILQGNCVRKQSNYKAGIGADESVRCAHIVLCNDTCNTWHLGLAEVKHPLCECAILLTFILWWVTYCCDNLPNISFVQYRTINEHCLKWSRFSMSAVVLYYSHEGETAHLWNCTAREGTNKQGVRTDIRWRVYWQSAFTLRVQYLDNVAFVDDADEILRHSIKKGWLGKLWFWGKKRPSSGLN